MNKILISEDSNYCLKSFIKLNNNTLIYDTLLFTVKVTDYVLTEWLKKAK